MFATGIINRKYIKNKNLLLLKISFLILFLLNIVNSESYYYCDPDLCKLWNGTDFNYENHIGCNNNGTFSKNCSNDAHMVEMTPRRIKLILDLHNKARNKIALGLIPNYDSAENMPIMKWDNELQYLSSLNVKTCKFAHDTCRNTARHPYSGQNIGISWQNPPFHSNSKRIKMIIGLWFQEYKDANMSFIDAYEAHPEGKKIGHFTMMVSDRAKRVGCSASRFTDKKKGLAILITCNYDFNSIYTEPVYRSGLPATNCTLNKSEKYPGLCEWDEDDYDVSEESSEIDNEIIDIPELF